MDSVFDAIVVVAGPAGAITAYYLARAGVRVALLEKDRLPRYKPCGGGLTAKTVQEIPFDLSPVIEDVCHDFAVSFRLRKPFVRHSHRSLVYMVMRDRFDHYLAEQAVGAGAALMEGTPVTDVAASDAHVEVQTDRGSLLAATLIGADGANGVVGRKLGLGSGFHYWVAWENEIIPNGTTLDYWRGRVGLDLGALPAGGYGWIFPKRDHLSIGAGAYQWGAKAIKDYYRQLVSQHDMDSARVIQRRGQCLPIRPPGSPVQSGRALLAGDAAGLVDGFTSEGIYWAARSGKLAAEAVLELLAGQTRDLLSYERRTTGG